MSRKNSNAIIKIPKLLKSKLNNKKINKIYKEFENSLNLNEDFIVAVSGGPDSLALAFLAKIYSLKKNLRSEFIIVDHKLRKESTIEAKFVNKILKKFYIESQILTWRGKKPLKNIQSLARKKRYEILFDNCKKLKIRNILLGHHQDDLFENFLIRILRGSGLKGLVSLNKKNVIENINILRPLLDFKKKDLIFAARYVFNYYVKDPSNIDDKFKRIRIRKLLLDLENEGLDKRKFIKTIDNLKYSEKVINFYVDENLNKNSFFSAKENRTILNYNEFFSQPHEIIFRSLSNLIKFTSKNYYPVRGKKIEKIIEEIKKKSFLKATLGGCIIKRVNQTVIISKEH